MNKSILTIPIVILCGGKSSRMKRDKSLLPFANSPTLLEYQYSKYSKLFENVYISSKKNSFQFINSERIIVDKSEIYSPMIALDSIFEYLNEEKIFIISVDMPLVEIDTVFKIIDFSLNSKDEIVVAKDEKNTHNLCGIFDKSIKYKIENSLKEDIHKINYLIRNSNSYEFYFENKEQFININFPNDYELAKNIINSK